MITAARVMYHRQVRAFFTQTPQPPCTIAALPYPLLRRLSSPSHSRAGPAAGGGGSAGGGPSREKWLLYALPQTKATLGSNYCDVTVHLDARTHTAIAIAALDNLGRGAAGQAVQNMNLMFGLPETTGLLFPALFP